MAHVLNQQSGPNHVVYNADVCEAIRDVPDDSIGYSIESPPFSSLYVFSDSVRDMGNCDSYEQFMEHYRFLIREKLRATKPGRNSSTHCMNLPASKAHDGFIGIKDFRGDIIRAHEAEGWIYHSEVCIWKNPVVAMQRTKALGLLHKQVMKDSCMSRQGIADYLCTFRKPGQNTEPVTGKFEQWIGDDSFENTGNFSIDVWQRYASPVWMDINQTRTLQYTTARDERDERHISPLQLDVIERGIELWSNPGDVVLSSFGGIGSEPYCAVTMGRKAIAFELKPSYFKVMAENMRIAESKIATKERSLFDAEEYATSN